VEEQVESSSFLIAGHRDSKLARRFVVDYYYNSLAVLVLNGTDVRGVHQSLAVDAQQCAAGRHFDGCQREVTSKRPRAV